MNPISLLSGIWGYVGAALVAALISAYSSYWITSRHYQIEIAHMQTAQAQAQTASVQSSLAQLQKFISSMNAAGVEYESSTSTLMGKLDALQKEFHNAIKPAPLPADCRPDAQRMHLLTEAVTAANTAASAGGFGETMRTAPTP